MIYLIHFDQPLHHANHYVGFVDGDENAVKARLEEHRAGWGAKILAACNRQGITYNVVRTMPGDRNRERQIKNGHKTRAYCPICSQQNSKQCKKAQSQ